LLDISCLSRLESCPPAFGGRIMKYRVTTKEVHNQDYIVEANSPDEAKEIVADGGGNMDESSFCYDYMLEPEYWLVKEEI